MQEVGTVEDTAPLVLHLKTPHSQLGMLTLINGGHSALRLVMHFQHTRARAWREKNPFEM